MSGASRTTERVAFRLLRMPCCQHLLCWVNPRLPTYCPECGAPCIGRLRTEREAVLVDDRSAMLTYSAP